MVAGSEYAVIQVFAVTGLQWLTFDEPEGARSVGQPLGPQEDGAI